MIYKCSENYICEFTSVAFCLHVVIVLIFRGLKWQKWTFRLCVQSWKPLNLVVNKIRRKTVVLDYMQNHFPGIPCAWVGNLNPVWECVNGTERRLNSVNILNVWCPISKTLKRHENIQDYGLGLLTMSTWFTVNYGLEYRFKHVVPVIPPLDGSTCAFNIQYAAAHNRLFLHGSTYHTHFKTFNVFYMSLC